MSSNINNCANFSSPGYDQGIPTGTVYYAPQQSYVPSAPVPMQPPDQNYQINYSTDTYQTTIPVFYVPYYPENSQPPLDVQQYPPQSVQYQQVNQNFATQQDFSIPPPVVFYTVPYQMIPPPPQYMMVSQEHSMSNTYAPQQFTTWQTEPQNYDQQNHHADQMQYNVSSQAHNMTSQRNSQSESGSCAEQRLATRQHSENRMTGNRPLLNLPLEPCYGVLPKNDQPEWVQKFNSIPNEPARKPMRTVRSKSTQRIKLSKNDETHTRNLARTSENSTNITRTDDPVEDIIKNSTCKQNPTEVQLQDFDGKGKPADVGNVPETIHHTKKKAEPKSQLEKIKFPKQFDEVLTTLNEDKIMLKTSSNRDSTEPSREPPLSSEIIDEHGLNNNNNNINVMENGPELITEPSDGTLSVRSPSLEQCQSPKQLSLVAFNGSNSSVSDSSDNNSKSENVSNEVELKTLEDIDTLKTANPTPFSSIEKKMSKRSRKLQAEKQKQRHIMKSNEETLNDLEEVLQFKLRFERALPCYISKTSSKRHAYLAFQNSDRFKFSGIESKIVDFLKENSLIVMNSQRFMKSDSETIQSTILKSAATFGRSSKPELQKLGHCCSLLGSNKNILITEDLTWIFHTINAATAVETLEQNLHQYCQHVLDIAENGAQPDEEPVPCLLSDFDLSEIQIPPECLSYFINYINRQYKYRCRAMSDVEDNLPLYEQVLCNCWYLSFTRQIPFWNKEATKSMLESQQEQFDYDDEETEQQDLLCFNLYAFLQNISSFILEFDTFWASISLNNLESNLNYCVNDERKFLIAYFNYSYPDETPNKNN